MRIVNLANDFKFKGLFYGAPGSEKTRLSASAALDPRMHPALMISAVGNPLSIRDYSVLPTVVELDAYKDLTSLHKWLKAGQPLNNSIGEGLKHPDGPYKTVIIDGLTYLQRWAAFEAVGNLDIGVGDMPSAMQQQHHGQVLARMNVLADRFYTLPLHVIFTALEYEQSDANQNLYYRVQLTGQASGEVPSYAYLVGRLVPRTRISPRTVGSKEAQHITTVGDKGNKSTTVLMLRPSVRYYAKNQYCKGPAMIFNPTMTKIMDMVAGSYTPTAEEVDAASETEEG